MKPIDDRASQPMDRKDLQAYIDAHDLKAVILPLDEHTATVSAAAAALGVEADVIIKSLVFIAGDEPLLVINNGLARVDRRKLAAHLGLGRKRVKFATAEEALAITGYAVGSMPPFGHKVKLPTLIDAAVTDLDKVYGGGGSIDAMMRLSAKELLQATDGEILELSE